MSNIVLTGSKPIQRHKNTIALAEFDTLLPIYAEYRGKNKDIKVFNKNENKIINILDYMIICLRLRKMENLKRLINLKKVYIICFY